MRALEYRSFPTREVYEQDPRSKLLRGLCAAQLSNVAIRQDTRLVGDPQFQKELDLHLEADRLKLRGLGILPNMHASVEGHLRPALEDWTDLIEAAEYAAGLTLALVEHGPIIPLATANVVVAELRVMRKGVYVLPERDDLPDGCYPDVLEKRIGQLAEVEFIRSVLDIDLPGYDSPHPL